MKFTERINGRVYLMLLVAAIAASALVMPYFMHVQRAAIARSGVAPTAFFLIGLAQTSLQMAVVIALGLAMLPATGFRIPYLTALARGQRIEERLGAILQGPLIIGAGVGIVILAADAAFRQAGIAIDPAALAIPPWKGLLASFYGGIGEEILMRLFLMTLFVFIMMKIGGRKYPPASAVMVWIAIVLSAAIFGIGHLPVLSALAEPTAGLVARTIVLNMIGGLAFGCLYWRRGLEAAMAAHFTADIVLHVLAPLVAGALT